MEMNALARPQCDTTYGRPLAERLGIVIVTHNRADRLLATLEILTSLEAPYPIVVVDNGSTDGTSKRLRKRFPAIDVVQLPENLGGGARNDGVRAVDRELVAFADDDSWWEQGHLAKTIALFDRHPRLGLVMSRVLAGPENRLDPCCELMSRSPLPVSGTSPGIPILGFMGCGVAFRREAFLANGGFQERFRTGGEEAIVAMDMARDGWELRYVPELVTHHHPAPRSNMPERRIEGIRADIWLACMRRRPRYVARVIGRQLCRAVRDPAYRVGIRQAYPRIPEVLRERRAVPRWLERQLELLERQRGE